MDDKLLVGVLFRCGGPIGVTERTLLLDVPEFVPSDDCEKTALVFDV